MLCEHFDACNPTFKRIAVLRRHVWCVCSGRLRLVDTGAHAASRTVAAAVCSGAACASIMAGRAGRHRIIEAPATQSVGIHSSAVSSGALTLDIALGGGFPKGRIIEVRRPSTLPCSVCVASADLRDMQLLPAICVLLHMQMRGRGWRRHRQHERSKWCTCCRRCLRDADARHELAVNYDWTGGNGAPRASDEPSPQSRCKTGSAGRRAAGRSLRHRA